MYKQPEQTYSSIYSDAPKTEEKPAAASYGYQAAAGQTAEAYYAQQEAISIMQQQQQEYEKQAAAYKRRERSRSPEVRRRERSRSPYKYEPTSRSTRRSPSPKYSRSSRDVDPRYLSSSSSSRAYEEKKVMDELLHEYQCGSVIELRDKLERSTENRSQRLANENLKNVYLTMVSTVQDSTYAEVQKLCTVNVQLQDEILRLGGKPSKSGSIKNRLGDERRQADNDPEMDRKLDQLQRDLEDEVAAKKELKRDMDKCKKERDESKKRAESYKSDYMACYEDLKIERTKTAKLVQECEQLKSGSGAISGVVKSESGSGENELLKAKNQQMQKEIDLQREQLKSMDRSMQAVNAKKDGYSFDIESDEDSMQVKKQKIAE
jgi:hypothetical protein